MKSFLGICFILLSSILLISSLDPVKWRDSYIKFNVYQSITQYPQLSDYPEVSVLSSKPNTAIGFTGGGARAYTAAIGQLAALTSLDLMKNVRYIGGISGGAWATTTYSYKQNAVPDKEFLGSITNPEDMTYQNLQVLSSSSARSFAAPNMTLIALNAYKNKIVSSVADAWSYAVFKCYLEPAGIPDKAYFSLNAASVTDIKSRNKILSDAKFVVPANSDRPYMILGTTLVGPVDGAPYDEYNQNFTLLEITPLYVGQMMKQSVAYDYHLGFTHHRTVSGAIEPFAISKSGEDSPYVGLASDHTTGWLTYNLPSDVFDLATAAGLSSYAPGAFVESLPLNTSEILGMTMNYWSPSDLVPSGSTTFFADGGSYENIPLISFLQRRVEKIILFFNSVTPLQMSSNWDVAANQTYDDQVSDCLSSFFGVVEEYLPWYGNRSFEYEKNQVYSVQDYITVIQGLQAAQASGQGIITTQRLTTIENAWWGIPAGITSEVTFVYLGRVKNWESLLSSEMKAYLMPSDPADAADLAVDVSSGPFKHFPHYATTGGSINAAQANALADQTGWVILENAALFEQILA
jgi:hypothetical protein